MKHWDEAKIGPRYANIGVTLRRQKAESGSGDMNPSISKPGGLKPTPDVTKPGEAPVAEMDQAAALEASQARELTPTPVMKKTVQIRPTSHWGLNE